MPDDDTSNNRGTTLNRHIGVRLRHRRSEVGIIEQSFCQAMNINMSQLVGWEEGLTRIPALQLLEAAQLLNCSPAYLYEGFSEAGDAE